jgi:hypothetical protein
LGEAEGSGNIRVIGVARAVFVGVDDTSNLVSPCDLLQLESGNSNSVRAITCVKAIFLAVMVICTIYDMMTKLVQVIGDYTC